MSIEPRHQPAARTTNGHSTASRVGLALGITAAALAGLAVANTLAARAAERRNPPNGRFVTVDGVRLHYLEDGVGPPVVLIHGNVSTAEDFRVSGLFQRLRRRHRVIAIDRPGFGHSERPRGSLWTPAEQATLLRHAFDALGIERPVVVGHSFGATVAVAMALDHPETVGGIVLLAGYYFPTARIDAALAAPPAIPLLGDVLRHTLSPPLGAAAMPLLVKGMFAPLPVPDGFSDRFPVSLAVRPGQIRASAEDGVTMVPAARAMRDRYGELRMPVAILTGTEDRVVGPDEQSGGLHAAIPHSTLHRVPGAGHMVHYADPDLVVRAIDRVAAQTRAEA
ncbi:alpha/beta fold hydrolase [Azospirillum agricola]|uniref:alpha/beta fold hydrolase n=1 Tax=Azospirillum agricola TaxID=1720247 RepID=UPI000A0F0415|nr:alpha/beta hydrolase [Azospirillum agricola]SMH52090.1 Pimeloyl-ACP methyl ester carboxylesterase [Azospirillum lipoferum]